MTTRTRRPETFLEAITPRRKDTGTRSRWDQPSPEAAPEDPHLALLRQIARSTESTRQWVAFWSILSLAIFGVVLVATILGGLSLL